MNVVEADIAQRFELLANRRHRTHELEGVEHRHVEDLGDALAFVLDFERVAIVALAAADFAGDVNVRQEVHLDADNAVALACLAAAALDVEGKAAGPLAAHSGLGQLREEFADWREEAGIGRGIGSRRAPDGALIDVDDLVEMFDAVESFDRAGPLAAATEFLG